MRKFNPERLYKLVRAAVIVTTIICIILVIMNNYAKWTDSGNYYKLYWSSVFSTSKACKEMYPNNEANLNKCFESAMAPWNSPDDIANVSLKIAFFLPLLFFGGRFAYKYVFPKVKKD